MRAQVIEIVFWLSLSLITGVVVSMSYNAPNQAGNIFWFDAAMCGLAVFMLVRSILKTIQTPRY